MENVIKGSRICARTGGWGKHILKSTTSQNPCIKINLQKIFWL
ncbi:MAG: hypothetical protein UY47_C0001G0079 [Parcubacteria group bacterium GW2011_GWB1_49_7]|nr:MAG: hypothetical protein UY47_C0001G0079 [Parcubacteria group bacterium GW2011_GWB1_49_7]